MSKNQNPPKIPLPQGWKKQIRSAVVHVLSLAQYAAVYTRSWAADSVNNRVRLRVEIEQLTQEIALLREEIRIKDARPAKINPHRRPHYAATERMAILELRAARHWCLADTARVFLITAATVASWMKRVDEEHRPHNSLGGKTPNEVYENRFPAYRKPRIEPRARWPRGSPCAGPQTLVAGKPGERFDMTVSFHAKHRHLPVVTLKRAA